jgi:hypothetical protein
MKRAGFIAALVLAVGVTAVALAGNAGHGGSVQASAEATHVTACAEQDRHRGVFGKCVSDGASAFGKCLAEAAKAEGGKPTEACADLKPTGKGGGDDGDEDEGTDEDTAELETSAADNPTTGLPKPPETAGRDFGQQVAANAGGNPGGASAEHNPTEGLTNPPETAGRDFGGQVSDAASGDHGPPS